MHMGGALGRLLFVAAKPHSLGGGGRQHRGTDGDMAVGSPPCKTSP
jgi:hypothetical protein